MPTRTRVLLRKAVQEQLDLLGLPRGHGPWSQERLDALRAAVALGRSERIARGWAEVAAPSAEGDGIYVSLGGRLYQAPGTDPVVVNEVMRLINEKESYRRHRARLVSVFAGGPLIAQSCVARGTD